MLRGRYGLSRESAEKIGKKLGFSSTEVARFCDLVESEHARARKNREQARARVEAHIPESQRLTLDLFQVISDWYHYAILELTSVQGFQNSPKWIAQRLGINEHIVAAAIERLMRLELIEETAKGSLKPTEAFTASPSDIPSDAIKKFHRQILEKALLALDFQGLEERDFTSIILAIDPKDMKDAKNEIKKFRRSFDARFGKTKRKTSVYCLGIHFFRLDEKP